jgi:hypothetical protein
LTAFIVNWELTRVRPGRLPFLVVICSAAATAAALRAV